MYPTDSMLAHTIIPMTSTMATSQSSLLPPVTPDRVSPDPASTSASVIELHVAPIDGEKNTEQATSSEMEGGFDNHAFSAGSSKYFGLDNQTFASNGDENCNAGFQRNSHQRLSKRSLELVPDNDNDRLAKTLANFIVDTNGNENRGAVNLAFTIDDPEEEKLRKAFDKSVESVKKKTGHFTKNKVTVKEKEFDNINTDSNSPKHKGINTEVIIHPKSELHKSYSLGCLMYQLGGSTSSERNVGSQATALPSASKYASSLVRSESFDTCLQPDPSSLSRWNPVPSSININTMGTEGIFKGLSEIQGSSVGNGNPAAAAATSSTAHPLPGTSGMLAWRQQGSTEAVAGDGGNVVCTGIRDTNITAPCGGGGSTVVDMSVIGNVVVDPMPKRKRPPVRHQSTLVSGGLSLFYIVHVCSRTGRKR